VGAVLVQAAEGHHGLLVGFVGDLVQHLRAFLDVAWSGAAPD
jgi:hypothetical protein